MSEKKSDHLKSSRAQTSSSESDVEQHPVPRSFDEVLASASDASAYGSQGDNLDFGDEAPSDGVSGIKLDMKRLSDMLECIPLPERLGVSEDIFLPEQVAEFERIAKQRLKAFDERVKNIATSEIRGDRAVMSEAEKDLMKVKSALKARVPTENEEKDEADDDDDIDGLNPDDIVDWLDKVLAK
ncbi:uncharacterized protein LOC111270597 [Varroa jacobsoni]|uniref:Uncharacterized protein n=1 Tax=Varroa destructor TaxID=109461 RepID=A0A7M7K781_VARDE|nr:uncharacterized protein LOC111249319 [Varroa destructor]XP_022706637.1 uncharacterized protein LOC111270597 [Varroa jacobsoni]